MFSENNTTADDDIAILFPIKNNNDVYKSGAYQKGADFWVACIN